MASLYSCSGRKKTLDGEKLKNHSPKYIIDSISKTEFDYTWLRTKGSAIVNFQGDKNRFFFESSLKYTSFHENLCTWKLVPLWIW